MGDLQYDVEDYIKTITVFINHVNSFHGKYIAKRLADYNKQQEQYLEAIIQQKIIEETKKNIVKPEYYEEEEEEEMKEEEDRIEIPMINKYIVYGTFYESHDMDLEPPEGYVKAFFDPKSSDFYEQVMGCKYIIYDICGDINQAQEALEVLEKLEPDCMNIRCTVGGLDKVTENEVRYFILLTNYMTWIKTKPIDEEDPEIPFNESIARRRKAHHCYLKHKFVEGKVVEMQKTTRGLLRTLVVLTGAAYGEEEDIFHYIFKMGYYNKDAIDVFFPGNNYIPMIYIHDLVGIMLRLMMYFPEETIRYIFAVQPEPIDMLSFARAISKEIGGPECTVRLVPKEELFSIEESIMSQRVFQHITVNMRMVPSFLTDYPFSNTDIETMAVQLVEEYKRARNLGPLKIIIDGPPMSGKTTLAKALSHLYQIPYINPKKILDFSFKRYSHKIRKTELYLEFMQNLPKPVIDGSEGEGEELEIEGLDEMIADAEEKLANQNEMLVEINAAIEQLTENETPPYEVIARFLIDRLSSWSCQKNQGYIIDGFPYVAKQAATVFLEEGGEENILGTPLNLATIPTHVIILEGPNEIFCRRVQALYKAQFEEKPTKTVFTLKGKRGKKIKSQSVEEETKEIPTLEDTLKKHNLEMKEYENRTEEDVSLLNFFYDKNIIPYQFVLLEETTEKDLLKYVQMELGPPKVYPMTREEIKMIQELELEREKTATKAIALKTEMDRICKERKREEDLRHWTDKYLELKFEEEQLLEARSLPLRHYLMKFVLPTVIDGLTEIARVQPRDAIDFLAEYLFKTNPHGYMMDPAFSPEARELVYSREFDQPSESESDDELHEEFLNACPEDPFEPHPYALPAKNEPCTPVHRFYH